jgi:hypothetical protein
VNAPGRVSANRCGDSEVSAGAASEGVGSTAGAASIAVGLTVDTAAAMSDRTAAHLPKVVFM